MHHTTNRYCREHWGKHSPKIIASRMSPAVSVEFSKAAMESVQKCIECGICEERCPYELPIEEMLKANYDLYEQHRELVRN